MTRRAAGWVLAAVLASPAAAQEPFPAGPLTALRAPRALSVPDRDPELDRLCAARAAELAAAGVLSHEDRRGLGPGVQSVRSGYPAGEFGEVLGAGSRPEAVWEAWLASPAHREVLLTAGWTRWGAGQAARGATTVWVLRFWKP